MRRVALLAPPGAVPFDIGTALHVFGHCPGGRYAVEVCAAAATIGALPRPDSLENSPRATP